MRIVSLHKDFYDYLQYQYGQDLNIHWERDFLIPYPEDKIATTDSNPYSGVFDIISQQNQSYIVLHDKQIHGFSGVSYYQLRLLGIHNYIDDLYLSFSYNPHYKYYSHFAYVSILGIIYPIIRVTDKNHKSIIFRYFDHDTLTSLPSGFHREFNKKIPKEKFIANLSFMREYHKDLLLKYHRLYKTPIFLYTFAPYLNPNSDNTIYLRIEYPVLSEFPGLVNTVGSPEDLYQNIYNFFIELKNNEDILPPVELNNKGKILKAGFDLKQSFRHRK